MRTLLAICVCILPLLLLVPAVEAGTPSPLNSSIGIFTAPGSACHWVFYPNAGLDALGVTVFLNDQFGAPCADANVSVFFRPVAGNVNVCPEQASFDDATDLIGSASFTFTNIYGRGTFLIDAWSDGLFIDSTPPLTATSPDLDGNAMVDIWDLGIWATSLPVCPPPPTPCCPQFPLPDPDHDYTCDACVNIFDLGVWAGGLLGHCD